MSDRRNLRALYVQLVDTEEFLFVFSHFATMLRLHVGDEKHVRTLVIKFKPIRDVLTQHAGREGSEAFAIFDLEIHDRLHQRRARIANDAASAERAWPKLHTSL